MGESSRGMYKNFHFFKVKIRNILRFSPAFSHLLWEKMYASCRAHRDLLESISVRAWSSEQPNRFKRNSIPNVRYPYVNINMTSSNSYQICYVIFRLTVKHAIRTEIFMKCIIVFFTPTINIFILSLLFFYVNKKVSISNLARIHYLFLFQQ
jgi:hypothetical protein